MRTGQIAARILTTLFLALAAEAVFGLELGLDASAGNLQFPWEPVAPVAGASFPGSNYFVGGEAWMTTPLGEDAAIRLSYERDPVLRSSAIAAVAFERGIASISVGPQFGFLNSTANPFSLGLSASVRLQWPGVAYVSMRSDGGMAISLLPTANDPQARTELAAGIYVPNAILSGIVSAKRFSEVDAGGSLVTDSLTRYAMTIDVYKKNVPYTALLSMGYELRSKHFVATDTTDSLGAIVLGIDTTAQLDRALKLKAGFSTGAYVLGLDSLKGRGPANSTFLFSSTLGIAVDLAAIKSMQAGAAAEAEALPRTSTAEGTAAKNSAGTHEEPTAEEARTAAELKASSPHTARGFTAALGGGIYYDLLPTIDLYGLRAGIWGDLLFPLAGNLGLGGELGLLSGLEAGFSGSYFELPLNAKLAWTSGKLELDALVGLVGSASLLASGQAYGYGLDAGARAKYLGFYAEASYTLGLSSAPSYPRFGLGYSLPLAK